MKNIKLIHPLFYENEDNEIYKIAVSPIKGQYFIYTAKNENAKKEFKKLYNSEWSFDKKKNNRSGLQIMSLLNTLEKFEQINGKDAYKEFIIIKSNTNKKIFPFLRPDKYPEKPNESFELLKEWYDIILEIKKTEFLKNNIDNSHEILNTFEIEVIEKLTTEINEIYFPNSGTSNGQRRIYLNERNKPDPIEVTANKTFLKWLSERKAKLEQPTVITKEIEKIHWTGKPSQLGYFVSQFIIKGFIELPSTRGEGSFAKLGKLFFQYFEIKNDKGVSTTEGNLIKEFNPEKNTLSAKSRLRITIPDKKDI